MNPSDMASLQRRQQVKIFFCSLQLHLNGTELNEGDKVEISRRRRAKME